MGGATDGETREMVEFTLAELFDSRRAYPAVRRRKEKLAPVRSCCVYVVLDGTRVLYVGATNYGPRTRLRQHRWSPHRFGRALREAGSAANAWRVRAHAAPDAKTAREMEAEFINVLAPVFND